MGLCTLFQNMCMKHSLLWSAALIFSLNVSALGRPLDAASPDGGSEPIVVPSVLKSVMVFREGAEMTHTASVDLPSGSIVLAIDHVSNELDLRSLQVHLPGGVSLLGSVYSTDFLNAQPKSNRQKFLEDSLVKVQEVLGTTQLSLDNTNTLLSVLSKNQELKGSATGMNIADLQKLMDYYKTASGQLMQTRYDLNKKIDRLKEEVDRLTNQINEESTKNTSQSGRLILKLYVMEAVRADIALTYLTENAGWSPSYEIQVKDEDGTLRLVRKAGVHQSTGLNWQQVTVALSTGRAQAWSQAPVLNPWYIGFRMATPVASAPSALNDVVVNPGYSNKQFNFDNSANARVVLREQRSMAAGTADTTDEDVAASDEQQLSTVYTINHPCDLPSTGVDQTLTITTEDVKAHLKYFAVPKLSSDVYLLADIPEWGKLDLLSGDAYILLNGTYVGQTRIDPSSTQDTFHLTVGKDARITVQRTKISDMRSDKFLTSNRTQKYTYEITVKNNKKDNVTVDMVDQFPVSTNKDIEINLDNSGSAVVDNERGILKWKVNLKGEGSQKIQFGYTLKYPKDKEVTLR
jgi:uncharacterized protein (TIGR02231 family)